MLKLKVKHETAYEHFSETSAGIHVFLNTSRHKHCSIINIREKISIQRERFLEIGIFWK